MQNRRQTLRRGAAIGLAAGLWNTSVFATVYLDIEQARKLLLPQATSFQPWRIALDAQALDAIAQATQTRVPASYAPAGWIGLDAQGARVGFVLADHVIGRYEWIDYAAGFAADGTLTQVEVLAYRESHGTEIRNISGATLSCQHVTEGVQRLSAIVQQQLHRTS